MLKFQQYQLDAIEPLLAGVGYDPHWDYVRRQDWLRNQSNFTAARTIALRKRGIGPRKWAAFLGCMGLREIAAPALLGQ